jgi:hypothetical protein
VGGYLSLRALLIDFDRSVVVTNLDDFLVPQQVTSVLSGTQFTETISIGLNHACQAIGLVWTPEKAAVREIAINCYLSVPLSCPSHNVL